MDSEGTSTSSDKDRMAATESAVNILAQGKRNMVCGEIPTAVNQFQEACRILSKAYGETAKECADAYFCYGQALLDLARMENGVLGNALQGVPDTDEETAEQKDEQKDEQFEKAELKDEEREKLRKEVYDAMGEKEEEKKEREMKEHEKKETGETMEVAMDTELKREDRANTDDKETEKSEDRDEATAKDKEEKEDRDKKDDEEDKKEDRGKEKKDESRSEDAKTADNEETDKKEEEGEGTEEEGEEGEEEGEGTEEEGEATEEEAAAEGAEAEAGETTSQDGSQDGENPDDVSNLQLAWEMLELAKLIYSKDDSKEAKLRVAESHLKLGEVSLETEQYEEAIRDLNKCLEIQKEHLERDNRLLAETYYQLGLAYCFNKNFQESTDSYGAAIRVIEDRVANLNKVLEAATPEERETSDFDHPVYKAKKEIGELREILPDINCKIEDVEDEKKNLNDLRNLAKEAMGGLSSSSESKDEKKPAEEMEEKAASDISHLIKRKRKSEEVEDDTAKKAKSDEGAGDAPKENGHQEEKSAEPMETRS